MMTTSGKHGKFRFAIDRGGTFTDVFARCPDNSVRVMKLLSVDPKNYRDAPVGDIVDFAINFSLFEFFPPVLNRLRAFDVSWKMKLDGTIRKTSQSTPLTLSGLGWALQWRQMPYWRGRESVLAFLSLPASKTSFTSAIKLDPNFLTWPS